MRDRYTSGAHGQNMQCSCAFHLTHWHGMPRIFLTAPLSYAAETYAMSKVSSFRATENSQPVRSHFLLSGRCDDPRAPPSRGT
jgi:hypothetical protein